jgi:N4-gp56 family major capsid protein
MALNNFISELWSNLILYNLHKSLVYASPGIINRDYEGQIRQQGNTVHINAIGAVTITPYVKGTPLATPQTLGDAGTTLVITQQDSFNFAIDDIDQAQASVALMSAATLEAGYAMGNTADQFVAGLYTQAASANLIGNDGAPVTPTATATDGTAAYELLVDLDTLLDEANVPDDGRRWVVVPPFYYGLLQKDPRFVEWQKSANPATLRTGEVGRASGFTILQSNNVPISAASGGGHYKILAGHPMAITYADQITEIEAYRPQLAFSDALKGLHLYGAKVVRPTALAVLTIDKPS